MSETNTYYVDPVAGSDANSGSARDAAWRSFVPVNALQLGPGDRVEVIAPGAFEHTLAPSGSGTLEAPISVHFAPGRYDFAPAQAIRRQYYISNANGDAEGLKAIGILIESVQHLRIAGPGACIVYRGKMIEICIDDSEDISIEDLDFDYQRPTVSEFTVTDVGADYAEFNIHTDSDYRVDDGALCWVGEGWSYATGLAQELIPETDEIWRRKDPLLGLRVEQLAPHRLRAHGEHTMSVGRVYQIRDTRRDCVGVFMRRSRTVAFRGVRFLFMHGMGVLCQFSEDITLDRVSIAPDPERGRTSAAWADCTHFSGCRGTVTLTDCEFCGAHDDAVNIHGTYLQIVEVRAENQVLVRFAHEQTYGFMAFNPGDEVDFVHHDSLAAFATRRVAAAEMLNTTELLLTLDAPAPDDWNAKDVLENVTWTPEVEISGCRVWRIPTRGFLVTTRKPVRILDNTFQRMRMNAIHIEMDAKSWFESGSVQDMQISGNRFIESRGPAILISPDTAEPNPAVHQNITITDNDFVLMDEGCAVQANGVTGLTIRENRIVADRNREDSTIVTRDCAALLVVGNTESPPPES